MYIVITLEVIGMMNLNISITNPIKNYKRWTSLNWFGVGIITIFINIVFMPYVILYWLIRFIYFTITVGRKD